jgi:hypothetical protein
MQPPANPNANSDQLVLNLSNVQFEAVLPFYNLGEAQDKFDAMVAHGFPDNAAGERCVREARDNFKGALKYLKKYLRYQDPWIALWLYRLVWIKWWNAAGKTTQRQVDSSVQIFERCIEAVHYHAYDYRGGEAVVDLFESLRMALVTGKVRETELIATDAFDRYTDSLVEHLEKPGVGDDLEPRHSPSSRDFVKKRIRRHHRRVAAAKASMAKLVANMRSDNKAVVFQTFEINDGKVIDLCSDSEDEEEEAAVEQPQRSPIELSDDEDEDEEDEQMQQGFVELERIARDGDTNQEPESAPAAASSSSSSSVAEAAQAASSSSSASVSAAAQDSSRSSSGSTSPKHARDEDGDVEMQAEQPARKRQAKAKRTFNKVISAKSVRKAARFLALNTDDGKAPVWKKPEDLPERVIFEYLRQFIHGKQGPMHSDGTRWTEVNSMSSGIVGFWLGLEPEFDQQLNPGPIVYAQD